MRTTVNAILGSLLCLSSVLRAADSPPVDARTSIDSNLKALTAIRDELAAKLDKHMASHAGNQAVHDLTLRLDEGADRDELDLVLPHRSGAWMNPYAVVPYWRQGTAKDRMKLLQQRCFSVPFDRFRYPIDAALLAFTDRSVNGSVEVTLGLDQLWEERFPPNSPMCLPNTGEVFSWYDIPREVGHRRLRKQNFTIDADIRKDVHEFVLYFNDAYNNGPLHMTFQVPDGGWHRADVRTPAFNLGWHHADVSGLTFKDGRLTGTANLTIAPDGFVPRNLEPRPVSLTIDGRADGGRFTGHYKIAGKLGYSDDDGEATGEVMGTVGAVVSGFYSATGELGVCHGTVSGTIREPPATCRGMLAPATGDLPSDGTVAVREATTRAVRLYQEIGALQLAFTQYPCPLLDAFADVGALTVEMDAGKDAPVDFSLDLAARYVSLLRSTAEDTAKRTETPFVAPVIVTDPNFGPFFGAEPLPTNADRRVVLPAIGDATGPQRWQFIPEWNVLGPFLQREGLDHNVAQLPDVVPASEGMWRQTSSPRVGRSTDKTFRWTSRSAANGRLSWTGEPWSLGWAGQVWYATTEVVADADREVWISVAAVGPAKLWINDRLVWVAEEHEFAFRDRQEDIVKLPLRKGSNRLLAKCRNDESVCWLRVHISTAGSPRTAVKTLAAAERVPSSQEKVEKPEPPLAWDLEKGINVRWKTPLGRGSKVAVDGKRLFVNDDPHVLHCLDADTGKEVWSAEVNILEVFGKEAMDDWKKAGNPEARAEVFKKYKLIDGRATTIADKARTAPVTDGQCVWVHMSTGVAACFRVDGQRLWIVRTPFASANLALADDVAIIGGATTNVTSDGGPYVLLALDRKTGEVRWKQSARGALLGLVRPTGASAPVVVAGWGQIFDASTGKVLNDGTGIDLLYAGGTPPGSYGVSLTPDGIFFATRLRVAYRMWAAPSGRVGLRFLWENVSEWGSNGNDSLQPLAADGLLYTWGIVQEAGAHCPSPRMELNVFDATNGRFVSHIKPVTTGSTSGITPVRIGDYLYLRDTGQFSVVRAGPKPYIVCRNYFPPNTDPRPVFCEGRLFLRLCDVIVCIAVDSPDGARYQAQRVAATIMEEVGAPKIADAAETLSPLRAPDSMGEVPVDKVAPDPFVPLNAFLQNRGHLAIANWWAAGPFPDHPIVDPTAQEVFLKAGATMTRNEVSAAFAPVARSMHRTATISPEPTNLQGYHVGRLFLEVKRLDARCATAGKDEGMGYLYTVLDNSRERTVCFTIEDTQTAAWLGGQRISFQKAYRLQPGLYPFLLRVEPKHFKVESAERQDPMDVARALRDGVLDPIKWPDTWTVAGPYPEAQGLLDPSTLGTIPNEVSTGGRTVLLKSMPTQDGAIDLSNVPFRGMVAYCFAAVDCPKPGRLIANASADWFMAWYVDGRLVLNTLDGGNGTGVANMNAHTFGVSLDAGRHVLAVLIRPGGKGLSVRSIGAMLTKPTDVLEPYVPAKTFFQRPTDVTKAIHAGALQEVKWLARWSVVSMPTDHAPIDPDDLRTIPRELTKSGKSFPAREVESTDNTVDLTGVVDTKNVAWCFGGIDLPVRARLIVNASADGKMEWFIDGKTVFNTPRGGNAIAGKYLWALTFAVELAQGKHVLAVQVHPSGRTCLLRSLGGMLTKPDSGLEDFAIVKAPPELSPAEANKWLIPHAGRTLAARMAREAAATQYNMTPAFVELPETRAEVRAWKSRVALARPLLQTMIAKDPGSDWAKRASEWLSFATE